MSKTQRSKLQSLWRILFVVAIVAVGILTLLPKAPLPIQANDKLQHGLAFAGLMMLLGLAWASGPRLWLGAISLVAYGAAIELAQMKVPGRQGELLDLTADSIGIIVGLALIIAAGQRFPKAFRLVSQGRR